jgi:hypothetical protein
MIQNYTAEIRLPFADWQQMPKQMIDRQIEEARREAIIKAIDQAEGKWVCVKVSPPEWIDDQRDRMKRVVIRVHCREVP